MSFIYKFFVFFIPVKTKEKLINYFSALLFNQQQKVWIEDVLKVLDQKSERLSSQLIQAKAYYETQFELLTLNHAALEGKLLSKINNQKQIIDYFEGELSKVIQANKQLTDEFSVVAQLIQKQEALSINLKKELVDLKQQNNANIKNELNKLIERQVLNLNEELEKIKEFNNNLTEGLDTFRKQQEREIQTFFQAQNVLMSNMEKNLIGRIDHIEDDRILSDSEYRNWELQFESKSNQNDYFENLLSNVESKDVVLDIGCGVGKLLEFAKSTKGADVKGVDISPNAISQCQDKGLDVVCDDALVFLKNEEENVYDYVTLIHIVEHIQPVELRKILNKVYDVLKPNGKIIIETPNTQSIFTLSRYYYMDSTHKRPKHPSLLKFVIEQIGFEDVKFDYSGDIPQGLDFMENNNTEAHGKLLNDLFYSGGGNIYIEGRK
jgi:2-polyprenyl-3-methyl-5-hydroxy-6-metoxy-1,4-benzoquinol methylase